MKERNLPKLQPGELKQWDEHRRILHELFVRTEPATVIAGTPVWVLRKDRVWIAHRLKKNFDYEHKLFTPKFEDLISLEEAKELQACNVVLFKTHNETYPVLAVKQSPELMFPLLFKESESKT